MAPLNNTPMPKNMLEAAMLPVRQYARFAGRSSRMEFWSYAVATTVLLIVVGVVATTVSWVLFLALLLPSLAVLVRRLHDVDRSGWWVLPIPMLGFSLLLLFAMTGLMLGDEAGKKIFIGIGLSFLTILALGITLLAWACRQGAPGPNRFGPPPRAASD